MDRQYEVLAQRPDIDEVTGRYEAMQTEMRERLSAEFGLPEWAELASASSAGCGDDFPDIDERGETWQSPIWQAAGRLPEEQWDRALAVVAGIGAEYGFDQPQTLADSPGDHEIFAADQYGARYFFGARKATLLNVFTGCHLTAQAHPGGGAAR